jgi:hypothetical protein
MGLSPAVLLVWRDSPDHLPNIGGQLVGGFGAIFGPIREGQLGSKIVDHAPDLAF